MLVGLITVFPSSSFGAYAHVVFFDPCSTVCRGEDACYILQRELIEIVRIGQGHAARKSESWGVDPNLLISIPASSAHLPPLTFSLLTFLCSGTETTAV